MRVNRLTVGPIAGATTGKSVRLWGRGNYEATESGPRRCFGVARLRASGTSNFGVPHFFKLNPNFDMTGVVIFDGLKPERAYEYQMGWFYSDLELEELDSEFPLEWDRIDPINFVTASESASSERSIVFGSCRYLLRLFGGTFFDNRGDKTFRSIVRQIDKKMRIDQFIMVGDQIYADDLRFIYPDQALEDYLGRYREVFEQPHIRNLMSQVPTYMTLDDHEIEDNWPSRISDRDLVTKYPAAIHAYLTYQLSHSPLFEVSNNRITGTPIKLWYTYSDGCCEFFALDTRTERELSKDARKIISDEQMEALKNWMASNKNRVKMIFSAVPFFPDMRRVSEDKWSGFLKQRTEILEFIRSNKIRRVVFLSGDVHCSLSAELKCTGDPNFKIISVVSSAFYWPYPHMVRASSFALSGPIPTDGTGSNYRVSRAGPVHATDNFTRIDVSLSRIRVRVYSRKGDLLGTKVHQF